MINFPFKNYAEFKDLFGIVEHGNGVKSRKNKILLAYFKSKAIHHYAISTGQMDLLQITDMAQLKKTVLQKIKYQGYSFKYNVQLINDQFRSNTYETDLMQGICEDGDNKCVRYIKHENDEAKTYKMKAGKFYKHIIEETTFGQMLPEQVKIWLMEEFTMNFSVYAMGVMPQNTLHVNKDFYKIYSTQYLQGNFDSCMVNRQYYEFYEDFVDADAAYLENIDGKIIARCVIFNKVHDPRTGETFRLAERQYALNGNDIYKRALVDALIKGGYIDGYKTVGANCGASKSFVDNEGNSLSGRVLYIDCDADEGDVYSYQDSFKYLSTRTGRAYNDYNVDYDFNLDNTYGYIGNDENDDEQNYDDWHDSYTANETVTVYVHGTEYTCDEQRLEDFVWISEVHEYHHKDDVEYCPKCKQAYLKGGGYHSPITDETYCCDDCCEEAEDMYKEANWLWSSYDEEYYRDEDEIKTYNKWDENIGEYFETTIHVDSYDEAVKTGEIREFDGEGYDEIDPDTQLPYNYEPKTEAINETLKEAV